MKEHIIITGSSGFIGTNLALFFLNRGYAVHGFDVREPNADLMNFHTFTHHSVDLTQPFQSNLKKINLDSVKAIFHLAAHARIKPSIVFPKTYYYNNLVSTLNVLSLAKEHNIPLIIASSSSVVENPYANPYTNSKHLVEQMVSTWRLQYGMTICSVRFFNVYGDYQIEEDTDRATLIGRWLYKAEHDKALQVIIRGDGKQSRDFTHVHDICSGLYTLYISKKYEDYLDLELGANDPKTVIQVYALFREYFKKNKIKVKFDTSFETTSYLALSEAKSTYADVGVFSELWKPAYTLERYLKEESKKRMLC